MYIYLSGSATRWLVSGPRTQVFILVVWLLVGWLVYLVRKAEISVVQQLGDCSADFITNKEGIFFGGLPVRRLVS